MALDPGMLVGMYTQPSQPSIPAQQPSRSAWGGRPGWPRMGGQGQQWSPEQRAAWQQRRAGGGAPAPATQGANTQALANVYNQQTGQAPAAPAQAAPAQNGNKVSISGPAQELMRMFGGTPGVYGSTEQAVPSQAQNMAAIVQAMIDAQLPVTGQYGNVPVQNMGIGAQGWNGAIPPILPVGTQPVLLSQGGGYSVPQGGVYSDPSMRFGPNGEPPGTNPMHPMGWW